MPARVTVKSHGSIKIEGDFELTDAEGNKFDLVGRTAISLCRCALSKTKPFCDHSHRDGNFVSEIRAYALAPQKPKS